MLALRTRNVHVTSWWSAGLTARAGSYWKCNTSSGFALLETPSVSVCSLQSFGCRLLLLACAASQLSHGRFNGFASYKRITCS